MAQDRPTHKGDTVMNDDLKRRILEEMLDATMPPEASVTDITLDEYIERAGIGRSAAKMRLKRLVDDGLFETFIARCRDGRQRRVYRKII